jgi:PBP1b-binding outer membrane lipoprotein LpoB
MHNNSSIYLKKYTIMKYFLIIILPSILLTSCKSDSKKNEIAANNIVTEFEKIQLPIEAQFSPIMNFTIADIDQDQSPEIIAIGNLYPTEVETTRHDASIGAVLKYNNGSFEVLHNSKTGISTHGDSKDSEIISLGNNKQLLLVSNNEGPLTIYQINKFK